MGINSHRIRYTMIPGKAADAIEAHGRHLELAALSEPTLAALRQELPDEVVIPLVQLGWSRTDAATICAARDDGAIAQLRRILGDEPVVAGVVEALERQRRAEVVAFGGVVVDDVEDDLDVGLVQGPDHGLELVELRDERLLGTELACDRAGHVVVGQLHGLLEPGGRWPVGPGSGRNRC